MFSLPLLALTIVTSEPITIPCEGFYPKHLQGICLDDSQQAIFWSFTNVLVKTDRRGKLLKKADVATHHGDLCFHEGRVYVAVNLGKFNLPAGKADSWVYVYEPEELKEIARHPVPEVVHGAGGMAFHEGCFYVVGGLPPGIEENYVYRYDGAMRFLDRQIVHSGYTLMGIQTVTFAAGRWWFGCYGLPKVSLEADPKFQVLGKYPFDAAYGIAPAPDGRLWVASSKQTRGKGWTGSVRPVDPALIRSATAEPRPPATDHR